MNATYRLQLRPGFGFAEVRTLLPYFRRLGISHLYLSPITEARPGSTHGYDVTDHNQIREELGGPKGFARLLEEAQAHGLALILDFVPNHAAIGPSNARWQDVLAYGPHSPYARYFDVEWEPLKPELRRKILLPFLGRPYGEALDDGEIRLVYDGGRVFAGYHEHRFAICPATYPDILETVPAADHEAAGDLPELIDAYRGLHPSRRDELEDLRSRLETLAARLRVDAALAEVSRERLHALLERQFWRLAYWKTAGHEVNYRRFFYVNDLVALRVEDEEVFADEHRLLGQLVGRQGVDGIRVDHIDGLADPHGYLSRLRDLGARRIWVEKILAQGETLPEVWPVDGTTGYDFLNDVMGVLTWPGGELPLQRLYRRFVPDTPPYDVDAYRSKLLVMRHHLAGELFRLAYDLDRISEADYHTRDFSFEALREAVAETIAALDRYRTYLPEERANAAQVLREAVHLARRRHPAAEPTTFDFIQRVLLGDVREHVRAAAAAWTRRFQQYASTVMAKGVEDTAFYRYPRLAALNEVGGDPTRVGLAAEAFHARARFRALHYPQGLLATATHDHKRGEDTRMRLIVLAEVHDMWRRTLARLQPLIREHRREGRPSAADIYLFLQTLTALWEGTPDDEWARRLAAYLLKAAREAKVHTSWMNPDADYEAALARFMGDMLADPRLPGRIDALVRTLGRFGFVNSMTQVMLKITVPGVPDFYQGCELLDLSLVDPDNRRSIDFSRRQRLLDELEPLLQRPDAGVLRRMLDAQDERLKLYITARLLRLRASCAEIFDGGHRALEVDGPTSEHVLAYAREAEGWAMVVIVPRFGAVLDSTGGGLEGTRIRLPGAHASGRWTEVLSGTSWGLDDIVVPSEFPLPWAALLSS